jgi:hypothetical protein
MASDLRRSTRTRQAPAGRCQGRTLGKLAISFRTRVRAFSLLQVGIRTQSVEPFLVGNGY